MADTILIVEDEPGLAELLAVNLQAAGYRTVVAVDGMEAMALFDRERPDLVTLDLNVPKVSGFRLLELFKRDRPELPVIAVTAYSFEEAEEIVRKGIDDFMTKPIDFDALAGRIGRAIERSRQGGDRVE